MVDGAGADELTTPVYRHWYKIVRENSRIALSSVQRILIRLLMSAGWGMKREKRVILVGRRLTQ